MHPNLRTFIDLLSRENEIITIEAEVDPYLEAAEIHRRVIERGGPALLFKRVKGSRYSVVTNLFGTERRIDLAFGPKPEAIMRELVQVAESLLPPRPAELWKHRSLGFEVLRLGTKNTTRAPVTEVCDRPARLDELPVLTTWAEDGGPFITLPLVYTENPVTKKHNLGIYRMQVYDAQTTGLHWQIQKGGGFHYNEAERLGQSLPVTVFLGGPPALILAAVAPLPEDVPEFMLASMLAGEKLKLSRNPLGGAHRLAAEAEFALVGQAPANKRHPEGPFGDHYGYYSLQHEYPVFEVEAVFHRRDAIFPATVVGKPRQEDFFIGDYLQSLLSPLFPLVMPGVRDLWTYGETGFHSLAAAVVQERYGREALVSGFRILGEGQLSLTKFLLLTDTPQDLHDFPSLLEHVLARFQPETDLFIFSNVSMDTLDYTSGVVNEGSKAIMLGVGEARRDLPREFRGAMPAGLTAAEVFCAGCLVVAGRSYAEDPEQSARLAKEPAFAEWPLVVLHDDAGVARSTPSFLWSTWTRFEPASDIYAADTRVERHHLSYRSPIVIDARTKPDFPKELIVRDDIAALVDRRWREYFPQDL
ncbi:MAG TPA: 4-hydroxybenzoate decarboxylase [Blastocatellia bacterium]|jgi:UbiD family decarboxylase|nr:4-hydroxybenzoate decarboxylase [Blastocatellia bacterium]HAF25442.1 4-hydroxybenzoate decarboxylase [Blastocatellia bacterium]